MQYKLVTGPTGWTRSIESTRQHAAYGIDYPIFGVALLWDRRGHKLGISLWLPRWSNHCTIWRN